ncbi:hypothetical protein CHUAL_006848 [Chamberlinius hualienensis]
MGSLIEVLKPFNWLLIFYGIQLEGKNNLSFLMKMIVIIMRIFDVTIIIESLYGIVLLRNYKYQFNYIKVMQIYFWLVSMLSPILLIKITAKVVNFDYWDILKMRQISPQMTKILKRKVIKVTAVFLTLTTMEQVFQVYDTINGTRKNHPIYLRILYLMRPVTFYFSGFANYFMSVIAEYVYLKIDAMEKDLKCHKSPYRMKNKIDQAFKEYKQLEQLSKQMDSLFSSMSYVWLVANILSISNVVTRLFHVTHTPFTPTTTSAEKVLSYFIGVAIIIFPLFFVVCPVHYAWKANVANNKRKQFIGKLLEIQLIDMDIQPLTLINHRVDQLCWILNHLININDEWFTVGFRLTFDMDMLLGFAQTSVAIAFSVIDSATEAKIYVDGNRS